MIEGRVEALGRRAQNNTFGGGSNEVMREIVAAKPAAINTWLKAHDIGVLEIKKRGMDVDPATFRRKLTLRGSGAATLILTRVGPAAASKRVAILAERVPAA